MSPKEIIEQCADNGLTLTVTDDRSLDVVGAKDWIDIWSPILRENKAAILAELENSAVTAIGVVTVTTPPPITVIPLVTSSKVSRVATVATETPKPASVTAKEISGISSTVLKTFKENNELKYSISVTDASTDPVLATVMIRGLAAFDMEIPKDRYDGMAILEMLESYTAKQEKVA